MQKFELKKTAHLLGGNFKCVGAWLASQKEEDFLDLVLISSRIEQRSILETQHILVRGCLLYCIEMKLDELKLTPELANKIIDSMYFCIVFENERRKGYIEIPKGLWLTRTTEKDFVKTEKGIKAHQEKEQKIILSGKEIIKP